MKNLSGHKTVISALIALWIVVTVIVLDLFHIEVYWPAFAVLNLLTVIGFTRQNILKIFLSCFAGIGISLLYIYSSAVLTPFLGATAAGLVLLFLVIFIILTLDEALPICLNVHTIIVFVYCLVSVHEFAAIWPHAIISAALGGGVALLGVLAIIKISPKLAGKKTEHENSGEESDIK